MRWHSEPGRRLVPRCATIAPMTLAEGIRKHGFRKWYERELLQGHAHLVLCFFCVIGVFGSIEAASQLSNWREQLIDGAALLVCAGVGLWALRRYLYLLAHAEAAANQAECPACKTYGRMDLLQSDASGQNVRVQCRKCGQAWRIDE